MARIRCIKPEFWASGSLSKVDFFSRLLFVALWNFADDEGRGRAIAKEINGFAFPLDDGVTPKEIDRGLRALEGVGCIRLYEYGEQRYFDIPSWNAHQVINRPTESKLPAFEDSCTTHGVISEASIPRARALEVEQGIGKGNGKGDSRAGNGPATPRSKFIKPTPEEFVAYFKEQSSTGKEAKKAWDYYEANGWKVGRNAMKDWKAACRGWIARATEYTNGNGKGPLKPAVAAPNYVDPAKYKEIHYD